ncbi:MAG: hypothetical protein DRI61_14630 [Chloroflexi bacterium]|nr:MAG: hypothetical protein DRI61_14630 [Chloroflexota bacterium]
MSAFNKPPRYWAYLLRCWEERGQEPGQGRAWRFSLENVHTGQRAGFVNLEEVCAFLRSQLEGEEEV